jgi:hypothetical protein
MNIPIEQVKLGVLNFVEREIATKAVGAQKFLTYMALPIVGATVEKYAKSFHENPATVTFFDENGAVDIDMLYNMAKEAVRKSGQFAVYGVILGESDIDKLYHYIKGGGIV